MFKIDFNTEYFDSIDGLVLLYNETVKLHNFLADFNNNILKKIVKPVRGCDFLGPEYFYEVVVDNEYIHKYNIFNNMWKDLYKNNFQDYVSIRSKLCGFYEEMLMLIAGMVIHYDDVSKEILNKLNNI